MELECNHVWNNRDETLDCRYDLLLLLVAIDHRALIQLRRKQKRCLMKLLKSDQYS